MSQWSSTDDRFWLYDNLNAWYSRARDPAKGRPLGRSFRVYKINQEFWLICGGWYAQDPYKTIGWRVAIIHPDNTFEFTIDRKRGQAMSPSLSYTLHVYTPFVWARRGKFDYRVAHNSELGLWAYQYQAHKKVAEMGATIRNGENLVFDLAASQWKNEVRNPTKKVDKEKRKVYLAQRKQLIHDVAVRAKLGVFDSIRDRLIEQGGTVGFYIDFSVGLTRRLLERGIADASQKDIVETFVRYADNRHRRFIDSTANYDGAIRYLLTIYDKELRLVLGVDYDG